MRDLSDIGKTMPEKEKKQCETKEPLKVNKKSEIRSVFPLEEKSVEDCISESISKRSVDKKNKKGRIIGGCIAGTIVVVAAVATIILWPKAPRGIDTPVVPTSDIDIASSVIPESLKNQAEGKVEQKENVYTFIIGGTDKDGTRTDVLMTLTLDLNSNSLNLLSIPRDSMVRAESTSSGVRKINSAYGTKSGIESTKAAVANVIGYYANRYCIVNLDSFVELIDAVGGVWYDVPRDMNYDDPTQDLHIHLTKGYQLLDGAHAIQLVRFRKGYSNADIGRIETTQGFLRALFSTLTQPKNITKFSSYANLLINGTNTDLTVNELIWLATKASSIDAEKIQMFTAPGYSRMAYGASYYILKENELLEIINEYMNPLTAEIKDVDILSGGKDSPGYSGTKTTITSKATATTTPKSTASPTEDPLITPEESEEQQPTSTVTRKPTPSATKKTTPSATQKPISIVTQEPEPTVTDAPNPTPSGEPEPTLTETPTPTDDPEPTDLPTPSATPSPTRSNLTPGDPL